MDGSWVVRYRIGHPGQYRLSIVTGSNATLFSMFPVVAVANPVPLFVRSFGSAGSGNGYFSNPIGICSGNGLLYVIDYGNGRVQAWTMEGVYVRSFGSEGSGNGQFSGPCGICSGNGLLYVADYGNGRVQVWTMEGVYVRSFGSDGRGDGQFSEPNGICSGNGLLYVTDAGNHRVQVWTPSA